MSKLEINDKDATTLWLGSFRYYLGRQSYAVSDFCDLLVSQWNSIPDRCKVLIRKELNDAFIKDDEMRADPGRSSYYPLGMDMDRRQWERVKSFIADDSSLIRDV